jgi:hypothetical protein
MSINYTTHTSKCKDTNTCPRGWLICFLDNIDVYMNEPYAIAPQCHLEDFISAKSEYLDGEFRYWQYDELNYDYRHYQPKRLDLNMEIRQFKNFEVVV